MQSLVEALKEHRSRNDISDNQLAQILGVSQATLSFIHSGARQPGVKVLRAIAKNIPTLKPYVVNYVVNGDKAGARRPGRPGWRDSLEKAGVNLERGIEQPLAPAFSSSNDKEG